MNVLDNVIKMVFVFMVKYNISLILIFSVIVFKVIQDKVVTKSVIHIDIWVNVIQHVLLVLLLMIFQCIVLVVLMYIIKSIYLRDVNHAHPLVVVQLVEMVMF